MLSETRFGRAVLRADSLASERCARMKPPRLVRLAIVYASRGGDGWLWYGVGLMVFFFGGASRGLALASAGAAAFFAVLLFAVLKRAIGRPRPHLPHAWAAIAAPDVFSFPSGHSLTAFAIAAALGCSYPELRLILVAAAAGVACSRVLLGLHYVTDVLAGSAVGYLIGRACAAIAGRLL